VPLDIPRLKGVDQLEAGYAITEDAHHRRSGLPDSEKKGAALAEQLGEHAVYCRTDVTAEQIDYGVQLLLSSVMFGVKHAIEPMKARGGGAIINCCSVAGIRYQQGGVLYSMLKAAVNHYTRLAGVELGPHAIRVNAISPAAVATPIFWGGSARANTLAEEDNARKLEKLKANLANATPLPRAGLADDIAAAALYLASDEGSFVNGHDLVVDGGRAHMFRE
jgi:NAD(P)-dependent dehydrogenase (short-subunit alcohol dehydrogenase family)